MVLLCLTGCVRDEILNPSENLDSVPVIDLFIDREEYANLLANKMINYNVACVVYFDGTRYAGQVRASGAGSRDYPKWSYYITLDDGEILGAKSFNLSNQIFDRTSVRSKLVLEIYKRAGFNTFNANHVFLRINSRDFGLYPMFEKIDEDYFVRRSLRVGELYKAGFESKLSFNKMNYPEFHFSKELPDDGDFTTLYNLIICVDNCSPESIFTVLGKHIDIGNYIRYHAISSMTNNTDALENNYFLYKNGSNSPFTMIPWDLDKSFYSEQTMPLVGENDIIVKLFQNDSVRKLYVDYCHYLLDNIFREDVLFPVIDATASSIRDAYELDPYLGGLYDLDEETARLKAMITARRNYYLQEIDGVLNNNYRVGGDK